MAANDSIAIPPRVKDLTGRNDFGRWTVLSYAGLDCRGKSLWHCQCDCGTISILERASLRSGHSKSCGCQRGITHGRTRSAEYNSWRSMKQRCYNPAVRGFHRYGGRNIQICERWKSFEEFYNDMGTQPTPKHSIERRDNDGHYSCGKCSECITNNRQSNCYWATTGQQSRNKISNRILTHNGQTMCITDWARHLGINLRTLVARVRRGWSPERALTQSVEFHEKHRLTFNGETKCISEWAVHVGINRRTLSQRLKQGWSMEKALSKK